MPWLLTVFLVAFAAADANSQDVLAHVENESVTRAEVEREVTRALGKRQANQAERAALEQEMLELVIDRRLVLRYLERTQQAASAQDIDFAVTQFVKQLGRQEKTLADYLAKEHLTEVELRRRFAWQLGWGRFLEKQLTDDNLQKYFEKNRRAYDGTELHVAHILWKTSPENTANLQAATDEANSVREQIAAGKLTFEVAAKKHSQAPTAARGGDIGWIRRHEPMPEVFSQAAFALNSGQISEPVVSPFGVHLIQVLDAKPGQATWQERREELIGGITRYLFSFLADRERKTTRVRLTGGQSGQ